ncbi:MAG: PH domain-containing protein [Pseudoxanthomonas suwonensis]|nr:PH domain-containing protein [Pseudoxanthomonas suwonensis]
MTPEPSVASPVAAEPDRRLHPWSWLFALISGLRQFIVPLLVLLFAGRRGDGEGWWELAPMIGVAAIALVSIWQYFTYRYRIDSNSVVIRSGLLHRSLRQIPFARIHNVAIHQSPLHRLFGVADVKLESAGGTQPEAHMQVLTREQALALEALVRRHARGDAAAATAVDGMQGPAAAPPSRLLLALSPGEIVRLGLISNRGMVVVAAAVALLAQTSRGVFADMVEAVRNLLFGYAESHRFDVPDYLLAGLLLLLGALLLLRLLSVALAFIQYHGFRLEQSGRRLTVERGLFSRLRSSAPRRRIQAWTLVEGVLHRLLQRRSLRVDSAVAAAADGSGQQRGLRELAPVATAAACDQLVQALLPGRQWPPAHWQPLHPRAWWRLLLPGVFLTLVLCALLGWRFGSWGLLGLLWLPWAAFLARQHARRAGWSFDGELLAVRAGWWSRHWRWADVDKLQALRLSRGPLDRHLGMATLWLDTAGAGSFDPPLRLRYLPLADAEALLGRLQHAVAVRPLRW